MKNLTTSLFYRKRFITDFELVSCDWRTSDTGEKKLQALLNADLGSRDFDDLLSNEGDYCGYADLSNKEDELKFKVIFIDKYTQIKYTVECGFFAGDDVEYETPNWTYISKWNTPEDPTEVDWNKDIQYNLDDTWGSKYFEDINEKTPPYSILSMTAEACEGGKYSPDFFNEMNDTQKESHLDALSIRIYNKDSMFKMKIMDYYFYNLISWNRHVNP